MVFKHAALIIVCHDGFFCGVIKLTTHDGTKFFIALAPAMLSANEMRDEVDRLRAATGDVHDVVSATHIVNGRVSH